jgi:hypothetical protein
MLVSIRALTKAEAILDGWGVISHEIRLRSSRGEIVVQFEGREPSWLSAVLERSAPLLELHEDWNAYGALAIEPEAVARGIELLDYVMENATPIPQVTPTPKGSIQFEWNLSSGHLEFEVLSGEQFGFYFEDFETGEQREVESTTDVDLLRKSVTDLTSLAGRTYVGPGFVDLATS